MSFLLLFIDILAVKSWNDAPPYIYCNVEVTEM